jgi:transposase
MASFTYHRKPNGTTYVYRQEPHWDKAKKRPAPKQVCIGKLGADGEIIYNKRFTDEGARLALERGESIAESVLCGQSLVLAKATDATGLERVLRRVFDEKRADALLSLAWAVTAGAAQMYLASVWIEQNECAAHAKPPTSPDISRILGLITQGEIEEFLGAWARHRKKATYEQYCYDITSLSSHNATNPFVEYGHNRDRENLAQVNMALLTGVASRIPTYYELYPGSLSDTKTLKGFLERMGKYGTGRIRMLLDRGFYSAANISAMLAGHIGFYIPVPANIKWAQEVIDAYRDCVEMPEHIICLSEDNRRVVYGMTILDKMDTHRVWKHIYYDTARRSEHIASFFASLATWEHELTSGDLIKDNQWAYDLYFTVKTTPKRGRQVRRNQEAINSYKTDRAGYWVILTNCEKDAASALFAYRERALVESQFDDIKNDLAMSRLRTHGPDTMRGRTFVQFLALIVTAQLRRTIDAAWQDRDSMPKDDRLARHYSLAEAMMRLGTYRKTNFPGRYGAVVSVPTKAQRTIFLAFGIKAEG